MQRGQTLTYNSRPRIRASAAIGGGKEGAGPLGADFDLITQDDLMGQDTWEQAESEMSLRAVELCLSKGGLTSGAVEALLCGDLLNQIIASGFAARQLGAPFIGLYGACSTMVEALVLGTALVDAGFRKNCVCAASSHFCAAERQYRYPLELGNQRPPSAQWTATAAGAALVDGEDRPGLARVTHGTLGKVIDYRIKDANHMGAAMAPAVADTLCAHLRDLDRSPADYDLIVTGDLGYIGRKLLLELVKARGVPIADAKLIDCGASLYDISQDTHAGGSGCGCIASILACHFLPMLESRSVHRLLALGSGAMLSPTSAMQGESIPSISYAVALEADDEWKL
ncbi:MAG: stage V sporulation protein AD [Clostridia bacterium]